MARSVAVRASGLLGFWLLLTSAKAADLPVGILTVGAATWASLRLLPPGAQRVRPLALAMIALRLLGQSIVAGADVARRALSPRLPLRPGYVSHALRLPPGPARDAFCMLTSLLPGTVPSGTDANGALLVHCLDLDQPAAAQLAADEARLAHALGGLAHALGERGDG